MNDSMELTILGRRLSIKSGESEEYVREVENELLKKISEVKEKTKAVGTLDMALLVALNVTDELIKTRKLLEDVEERSEELTRLIERRMAT
ncbi:MAG: cell division protein ZapA [Deltaproteobacteria bacterium]|nr:cell division protein ZapA [Deltaproteobacteria bacterium]